MASDASVADGFTPLVFQSLQGLLGKLSYNVGINWQLNRISYQNETTGTKDRNTQWAFNPSLQLRLPFGKGEQHSVSFSYKHLLGDIRYSAISSSVEWEDAYNYSVGNPDLKAFTEHLLSLNASFFRGLINLNALYYHDNNAMRWGTTQDPDNPKVFRSTPYNYDNENCYRLSADLNWKPFKWWRTKLSGSISFTPENQTIDGIKYDRTIVRHYYSMRHNFNFKHHWGGSFYANIEPTFDDYDRVYHMVYQTSCRVWKTYCNDNLQFVLDATPFRNRRRLDRHTPTGWISSHYTTPTQDLSLTVIWSFSGGKKVNVNVAEGLQDYDEIKDSK